MAESISEAYEAATKSHAYTSVEIPDVEALASQKANPELWAHKFRFALSVLHLTPGEAVALADNADRSYVSAKKEFNLNGNSR